MNTNLSAVRTPILKSDLYMQSLHELRGKLHFEFQYDLDQNFPVVAKLERALSSAPVVSANLATACKEVIQFIQNFTDPTQQKLFLDAYSKIDILSEPQIANELAELSTLRRLRVQSTIDSIKALRQVERELDECADLSSANNLKDANYAVSSLSLKMQTEMQQDHSERISKFKSEIEKTIQGLYEVSVQLDFLPTKSLISFLQNLPVQIDSHGLSVYSESNSLLLDSYINNFAEIQAKISDMTDNRLSASQLRIELADDLYVVEPGSTVLQRKNSKYQEIGEGRLQHIKQQTKKLLETTFSDLRSYLKFNQSGIAPDNLKQVASCLGEIYNFDQVSKALDSALTAPENSVISFSKFREKIFSLRDKILSSVRNFGEKSYLKIYKSNAEDSNTDDAGQISETQFSRINFVIDYGHGGKAELEMEFSNPGRAKQFIDYLSKNDIIKALPADLKDRSFEYCVSVNPEKILDLDQLLRLISDFSVEMQNHSQEIDFQFYDESNPNPAIKLWKKITSKWLLPSKQAA